MRAAGALLTRYYSVWLVGTAIVAYVFPPSFEWFTGAWITWALAIVMLGMGLTLKPADFREIFRMPRTTGLGLVFQFTVMPLAGWMVARLVGLEVDLAVGLILLASCPGGTASNMIAYLAEANVALSVVLTLSSTMCSFVMTPLWTKWLAGQYVPVDALGIALSTLKVVVAPVLLGVFFNWRFPRHVHKITWAGPPVAALMVCMITGGIVAPSADTIASHVGSLMVAVVLLHGFGFIVGFQLTRLFGFSTVIARTVSIEVGMQNGGMASVLAKKHFAANPMAAVPMVFSAVMQNVLGSILSGWWRSRPVTEDGAKQPGSTSRRDIHYWKCDRPAGFHGIRQPRDATELESALRQCLSPHIDGGDFRLESVRAQGNHLIWIATSETEEYFVRVEDGPENDDYLSVESWLLERLRGPGVPTPRVIACDASRQRAPFAWQILERIDTPDLQHWHADGKLEVDRVAIAIGEAVARWQETPVSGFGPFDTGILASENRLQGYHSTYADYFYLNLDRHLALLRDREFLSRQRADEIESVLRRHESLLTLDQPCLVHKDLAFWNILGSPTEIAAYIDWDDAIAGDPMDDISLMACFHPPEVVDRVLEGYCKIRALPLQHGLRLHLHLLRNMIVKAVIRVGAGYFDRGADFFLIGAGSSGGDLRQQTYDKIEFALRGLQQDRENVGGNGS